MAPPHLVNPSNTRTYTYLAKDSARLRHVSNCFPRISIKRSDQYRYATIGPLGCYLPVDELGLPVTPRIKHAPLGCLCEGYQEVFIMELLWKWIHVHSALFQIESQAVRRFTEDLVKVWNLTPMSMDEVAEKLGHWENRFEEAMKDILADGLLMLPRETPLTIT